ncbi:MAG TPA: peptidylprolyl isomerase [Sphingobacteriaceae bacterium]|nr:peptidylprolyl isomerase [Sphingobacteriaceae bacterium]
MNIKQNSVVAVTYDLYTTENDQEIFVEKADEENPLVFLYGQGMMLPKFEEYLDNLAPGDTYDFKISAGDAYGEVDETAITELPLDMFDGMDKPEIESILPLQDNEGNEFRAKVKSVTDKAVTVDLNHPMAGKNLRFTGKIIEVRAATKEELEHGHAHGVDGQAEH